MANNRMYLRCPCGRSHVLARIGAGGYWWEASKEQRPLTAFLEEHQECDGHDLVPGYGSTGFFLEYESGPDCRTQAALIAGSLPYLKPPQTYERDRAYIESLLNGSAYAKAAQGTGADPIPAPDLAGAHERREAWGDDLDERARRALEAAWAGAERFPKPLDYDLPEW